MRSNSVNIILPFTSRTRDSYHTQFYNRNDGAFVRVSVFGKEEYLKEAIIGKVFLRKGSKSSSLILVHRTVNRNWSLVTRY